MYLFSALGGEFDRDINEFMTELAKQVKRIKAFNDILNFFQLTIFLKLYLK